MMNSIGTNFEPAYAALFALLNASPATVSGAPPNAKWTTASRRLRHWADVPGEQQPALYQAQAKERVVKRVAQRPQWVLDLKIYVYCQQPKADLPTSIVLNPLLAGIRNVFEPDSSGPGRVEQRCTLGGIVFDAYIDGEIEIYEGELDQQAVAFVNVRLIMP